METKIPNSAIKILKSGVGFACEKLCEKAVDENGSFLVGLIVGICCTAFAMSSALGLVKGAVMINRRRRVNRRLRYDLAQRESNELSMTPIYGTTVSTINMNRGSSGYGGSRDCRVTSTRY